MQQLTVKYPYGISNFEQLVRDNYVFVDKTKYIELLESDERFSIFLRPRRMGKSLFISILEYYYDILEADKFDKLFSKYYIGQHKTPLASSYRVLKFDFSGINTETEESVQLGFNNVINSAILLFFEKYFVDFNFVQSFNLNSLFSAISLSDDKTPIYILVDEHDFFINNSKSEHIINLIPTPVYVKAFYETIKIATQKGFVDRFFITGVSPITLDSLTSGFNIGKHLSGDEEFHDLMGFTEKEVIDLLNLALTDKSKESIIMDDLKSWYNGYNFNADVDHTVYNSDMVLYFLDKFKFKQQYPKQMLDPNIMPDYPIRL